MPWRRGPTEYTGGHWAGSAVAAAKDDGQDKAGLGSTVPLWWSRLGVPRGPPPSLRICTQSSGSGSPPSNARKLLHLPVPPVPMHQSRRHSGDSNWPPLSQRCHAIAATVAAWARPSVTSSASRVQTRQSNQGGLPATTVGHGREWLPNRPVMPSVGRHWHWQVGDGRPASEASLTWALMTARMRRASHLSSRQHSCLVDHRQDGRGPEVRPHQGTRYCTVLYCTDSSYYCTKW